MTSFTSHSAQNQLRAPRTKRKHWSPRYIRKYNLKALDRHVTIHSLYTVYWNPSSFCTQPPLLLSHMCNTAIGPCVELKLLPWWRGCPWSGDGFYECLTELPTADSQSPSISTRLCRGNSSSSSAPPGKKKKTKNRQEWSLFYRTRTIISGFLSG